MARVVLVGLPGVGKSTVATALAAALAVEAIDADEYFAHVRGISVPDFLRAEGEAAFRSAETELLAELLALDVVIATGGGVVTTEDSRLLLERAFTAWLDAPDDILLARTEGGDRPLLGDDCAAALRLLRERRAPLYEAVASIRVDASGDVVDVTKEILAQMERVS